MEFSTKQFGEKGKWVTGERKERKCVVLFYWFGRLKLMTPPLDIYIYIYIFYQQIKLFYDYYYYYLLIKPHSFQISTWLTQQDCCAWEGVHCDNITGRVTKLDLKPNYVDGQLNVLEGEMNLCILELEFLSYLDLSFNKFDAIRIPSIQHNIARSSNLLHLDLSLNLGLTLHMDSLDWLSPLSSLKYLNLSGIDLHKETNWLQIVNTLPSLLELHLSGCNLNNFNPSIEYLNLSSLVTIYLSNNDFTSHLPDGFFNLTKDLTYVDLHESNIYGEIPSSLLNLQNLIHLDLKNNKLQGPVPYGIGKLAHVQHLDLSENQLRTRINSRWNMQTIKYSNP